MVNARLERHKKKIENGELLVSTGVYYTDPCIVEQLGTVGYDMMWIDQEHTGFTLEIIRSHIQAAAAADIFSMVRVVDLNPATVKPILEMAPDGVIFPMINTVEAAQQAIASCLYPPKGIRGFGPVRANRFGAVPMDEYIRDAEKCLWRILQIEHVEGVKNLDKILEVPGIDSIVVGPNDLSASLGVLGQYRHPAVMEQMDKIAEICNKHKIPFGVALGYDEDNINDWIRRGASWFAVGADMGYLDIGACQTLEQTRALLSAKKG